MDMLRKKVAELEQKVAGMEAMREAAAQKSATAEKQIFRLKNELGRIRDELAMAQNQGYAHVVAVNNRSRERTGFHFPICSELFVKCISEFGIMRFRTNPNCSEYIPKWKSVISRLGNLRETGDDVSDVMT